jgi:hypothetical protein
MDGPQLDDDRLNDAWILFAQESADEDDEPSRESVISLLEETARVDDPLTDDEVIDFISNRSSYRKGQLRNQLERIRNDIQGADAQFGTVTKIVSPLPDERSEYRIEMTIDGQTDTIRATPNHLLYPTKFRELVLDKFDTVMSMPRSEEWEERINELLNDTNVEVEQAEPSTPAHAAVERVLNRIQMFEIGFDIGTLRSDKSVRLVYDPDADEVLLPAREVEDAADTVSGEPDMKDVLALCEERGLLADPDNPTRELPEAGHIRLWRLSAASLVEADVLQPERLGPEDDTYE